MSNTDDHLRNHAFTHDDAGWRLAPAYDLNPTPVDVKPRVHALAIDEGDATASIETAFDVAPRFGLRSAEARDIARQVGEAVSSWRSVATKHGLNRKHQDRMESAFEHRDLSIATRIARL